MKQLLNALPLLIAIALLIYGGWQRARRRRSFAERSRPLGEVWQVKY